MDLAKSFGGLTQSAEVQPDQVKAEPASVKKAAAPRKPARSTHQATAPATDKAWTPGEGRSSNPDYGRLTVYLPKQLRTKAERKWEDQGGKDMSGLFERLLGEYVAD